MDRVNIVLTSGPVGRVINVIRDQSDQRSELERLAPGLRRYARALVARDADDPVHDADALTRDALGRAIRAERVGRSSNPRIWLYATLTTLNRARVRARSPVTPAAPANTDHSARGVTDALSVLPLDQREVLLLVVLEGFSYIEAADVLGLARGSIGARIARARATLEQSLDAARLVERRGLPRTPPYLRLVK